jgi:hypothetical protein
VVGIVFLNNYSSKVGRGGLLGLVLVGVHWFWLFE